MPGKLYTASNGAKYVKNARGQVRFVSGASKAYLAKIRKKRGKAKKGGGLQRKVVNTLGTVGIKTGRRYEARKRARAKGGGLGKIASGAATLGYGAYTGSLATRPGTTISAGRRVVKGVRKRGTRGTKGLGKIASGAATLGYGAYTGSLFTQPGTTIRAGRRVAKGVRKRGGVVNSKFMAPAKRKRRVGAGLSVHNKATVKFRARGVKSKT